MRITCPSCAAEYEVAANLLAARRVVRCARCGHDWTPPAEAAPQVLAPEPAAPAPPPPPSRPPEPPVPRVPELPEATITAPPAPAIPVPIPPRGQDAAPRPRRRAKALAPLGWAASILVLVALAWAGYQWRSEVVRAWPPSERLYAKLGLLPAP